MHYSLVPVSDMVSHKLIHWSIIAALGKHPGILFEINGGGSEWKLRQPNLSPHISNKVWQQLLIKISNFNLQLLHCFHCFHKIYSHLSLIPSFFCHLSIRYRNKTWKKDIIWLLFLLFTLRQVAPLTSSRFKSVSPQTCTPVPPKFCSFQSKKKRFDKRETFLQTSHFEKNSFTWPSTKFLLVVPNLTSHSQNTASGIAVHISPSCTRDSDYNCI